MNMYTEEEVRELLRVQRGNCYVAVLTASGNQELAAAANNAPEPGGGTAHWTNKKKVTLKEEALKRLLADSFQLQVNAGDFFYYSCAQMLNIVVEDIEWVLEHIQQFGDDGLYSVMAYIQNQKPIAPYLTDTFDKAIKVLVDRKQEVFGDIDWDYHGYEKEGPYRTIKEEWL